MMAAGPAASPPDTRRSTDPVDRVEPVPPCGSPRSAICGCVPFHSILNRRSAVGIRRESFGRVLNNTIGRRAQPLVRD